MSLALAELNSRLSIYLSEKWDTAVEISELARIPGGASRETYRFVAALQNQGQRLRRHLIVRRDPLTSLVESERSLEYNSYRAIYPTDIPVPEQLFLEEDPKWLDQPFSIMAEITGCQTEVASLTDAQKQVIGQEKWSMMGKLASYDPIELGFGEFMPVPAVTDCAQNELNYWEQVITTDEIHPHPVARAAARWLRKHLPSPAQKLSIVHGDFRSGNFLLKPEEGIKAILDWEMCHLGDPLEDLAWSMDPIWSWQEIQLVGRLLPRSRAIEIWEETSGLKADIKDFKWWQVFVSFKALALWISSCEEFITGNSKDPILAFAGWYMGDRQTRILIDRLSPVSKGAYSTEHNHDSTN
jgi:aminoglycoside phosphotransferase (APT) family kinase protein